MSRSPRHRGVFVLALATFGCATIKGPKSEEERRVVHSEQIAERFAGEIAVADATWAGETLRVRLERPEMCRDARKDSVELRQVTRWEADGLTAEIVAGSIFAVGGGLALGFAHTVDDTDPDGPGSELSVQKHFYIWGAVAAGIGAIALGHLLWVAGKSVDDTSPWVPSEVVTPVGTGRACGRAQVGSGSIFAMDGRERIELMETRSDQFEVVARKYADKICTGADVGAEVKLYWATKGSGQPVPVASYDRANCVRVSRARDKLHRALSLVPKVETADDLASALALFEEGRRWLKLVPASDEDHQELSENAHTLADMLADRSKTIAAAEVDEAVRALSGGDLPSGVRAASRALRVIASSGEPRAAWQRIYAPLVARLRSADDVREQLSGVLDSDRATAGCISAQSPECPAWLDAEVVARTFGPILARAAKEVNVAAVALRQATQALQRKRTAPSLAAMDSAREAASGAAPWCEGGRFGLSPLQEACAEAEGVRRDAETFLLDQAGAIAALRAEIAEKERVRQTVIATTKWRAHFSACRELVVTAEKIMRLQQFGQCGIDCRRVAERVMARAEELESFSVEESVDDPDLLDKLRDECRAAECRSCP